MRFFLGNSHMDYPTADAIFPVLPPWFTEPLHARTRWPTINMHDGAKFFSDPQAATKDPDIAHEYELLELLFHKVFDRRFVNTKPSCERTAQPNLMSLLTSNSAQQPSLPLFPRTSDTSLSRPSSQFLCRPFLPSTHVPVHAPRPARDILSPRPTRTCSSQTLRANSRSRRSTTASSHARKAAKA